MHMIGCNVPTLLRMTGFHCAVSTSWIRQAEDKLTRGESQAFKGGQVRKCICCAQVKSLSNLGWFLSIGTFGQLFAALVVVYKLVVNPWQGATTELVHNGELPVSSRG